MCISESSACAEKGHGTHSGQEACGPGLKRACQSELTWEASVPTTFHNGVWTLLGQPGAPNGAE